MMPGGCSSRIRQIHPKAPTRAPAVKATGSGSRQRREPGVASL